MRPPLFSALKRFVAKITAHRNAAHMYNDFKSSGVVAFCPLQQEPSRPSAFNSFLSPLRRFGL